MRGRLREQDEGDNLIGVLNCALGIRDGVRGDVHEKRKRQSKPDHQAQHVKKHAAKSVNLRVEQEVQIQQPGDSVRRGNFVKGKSRWRCRQDEPSEENSHHHPLVQGVFAHALDCAHSCVASVCVWSTNSCASRRMVRCCTRKPCSKFRICGCTLACRSI